MMTVMIYFLSYSNFFAKSQAKQMLPLKNLTLLIPSTSVMFVSNYHSNRTQSKAFKKYHYDTPVILTTRKVQFQFY